MITPLLWYQYGLLTNAKHGLTITAGPAGAIYHIGAYAPYGTQLP